LNDMEVSSVRLMCATTPNPDTVPSARLTTKPSLVFGPVQDRRRDAARRGHGVRLVRQAGGSGPLLRSAAQWSAPRLCPFDRSSYSRLGSTPRRCWHVNPRHVVNCVYRVETSEQRAGTAD
jgi:hypothetical protein